MTDGLHRLLPAAAAIVAHEPQRAMSAFANALHQLASTPGARAAEWIDAMDRTAPLASDVAELLALGQVAAWRAGMAHYRAGALAVTDQLAEGLALVAVGASASDVWPTVRARLAEDPWFVPGRDLPPTRVALCTGAFRGFGGLFSEPPQVLWSRDQLLVRSGEEAWLLAADAFGATFHRASVDEVACAKGQPHFPPGLGVAEGSLVWHGQRLALPASGKISSAACAGTTLALTSQLSHAVVLVSLGVPA